MGCAEARERPWAGPAALWGGRDVRAWQAAEICDCFADADLCACARRQQGRAFMHQHQVAEGLALLDEAMVAAAAGEVSPIMTGLNPCSVVEAYQQGHALDQAREWTAVLTDW